MAVRLVLPDEAWAEMAPIRTAITARAGSPPGLRERRCMAAVLSLARTGTPWRDLPEAVGHWEAVAHRLRRWARRGRWRQRWERLQTDPSPQTRSLLLAAPLLRAQPHAAGAFTNTAGTRPRLWAVLGAASPRTSLPAVALLVPAARSS